MTNTAISPLRQRMIDDMTIRGFAPKTQRSYLRMVRDFTAFVGRSPDTTDAEDLRRYQHHMRTSGATATSMNAAVSALRFFFGVTLGRGDANTGMTTVRAPKRLPVVLSPAGGRAPFERRARAQVSCRVGSGLWYRTARIGGGFTEGHRH